MACGSSRLLGKEMMEWGCQREGKGVLGMLGCGSSRQEVESLVVARWHGHSDMCGVGWA